MTVVDVEDEDAGAAVLEVITNARRRYVEKTLFRRFRDGGLLRPGWID